MLFVLHRTDGRPSSSGLLQIGGKAHCARSNAAPRGPTRAHRGDAHYTLFPLEPGVLYVNFGFWDVVRSAHPRPPGDLNRMIEREVQALGGIKSLYSDAYFLPEEFRRIYGGEAYRSLKRRYDPHGSLLDLYQKCVLRH